MNIQRKTQCAFTMIKLMVILLIVTLVMAGIRIAMANTPKGFTPMYEHEQGDMVTDADIAMTTFESVCRKATIQKADIDTLHKTWVKVYYYANPTTSIAPDRCAKFEIVKGQLIVCYGDGSGLNLGTPVILAHNVTSGQFVIKGRAVLMTLTLDNARDTAATKKTAMTITSTALRYNE